MVFLVVGAWFGLSCLLLFLLRGFRCFPFFFSFSEEARHAAWFFFLNYSPGREERCWEGLQCEICSGRARAEAAYEWVAVFGRCSMLPRTFYMNGVCLSALCDQERQRCCVAADFPGDLFVFFFLLLHWPPPKQHLIHSFVLVSFTSLKLDQPVRSERRMFYRWTTLVTK